MYKAKCNFSSTVLGNVQMGQPLELTDEMADHLKELNLIEEYETKVETPAPKKRAKPKAKAKAKE